MSDQVNMALNVAIQDKTTAAENLRHARNLVLYLEAGDMVQADMLINELCASRENDIYQDLGKLTRDLHDSLNDIGGDTRLNEIMNNEMPDAKHNLDHVIELTEDAANKTLTAVENCFPVLDALNKSAATLQQSIQQHTEVAGSEPLPIIKEMENFIGKVCNDVRQVQQDMNEILLAQGYQDLSGQIIQRVSKMVSDVENSLLGILKINSHRKDDNSLNDNSINDDEKNRVGHGPAVPGVASADVLNSQEDVDDLLSTLGF